MVDFMKGGWRHPLKHFDSFPLSGHELTFFEETISCSCILFKIFLHYLLIGIVPFSRNFGFSLSWRKTLMSPHCTHQLIYWDRAAC